MSFRRKVVMENIPRLILLSETRSRVPSNLRSSDNTSCVKCAAEFISNTCRDFGGMHPFSRPPVPVISVSGKAG